MNHNKPSRDDVKQSIGTVLPVIQGNNFTKWCCIFRLAEPYLGEEEATKMANEFEATNFQNIIQL